MRAQVIRRHGGPEVFEAAVLPTPVPGPGDVLVRVAATSVNPVDAKIRQEPRSIGPDLPAVLGCDVAGVVEAVGDQVKGFAPGDAVYGCVGGVKGMGGTYADYVLADPRLLAPKPASLDVNAAAALPLVTITAWEALDRAGVAAGQTVLIRGGTGGVGHVAVQLAKARGAHVVATVSSDNKAELAKRLGADGTANHRTETPEEIVAAHGGADGFDVVIDATGGTDLAGALAMARPSGQVATIVSMFAADLTEAHAKGLSIHVVFMLLPMLLDRGRETHGRILRAAAALADAGQLTPVIDQEPFDLNTVADAHRRLESGRALGKIVIDVARTAKDRPLPHESTAQDEAIDA